jgi:drug/metabolite transporter (DMT)-like permease
LVSAVVIGLLVALSWGIADTLASSAAKRVGTLATTFVAQAAGLLMLVTGGLLVFPQMHLVGLSPAQLVWTAFAGVLLGCVGSVGYLALYQALKVGSLSLNSPLIAANGAVTMVLAIVMLHEGIDSGTGVVLGIILVGVLLASLSRAPRPEKKEFSRWTVARGVSYAFAALLGLGTLNFGLGAVAKTGSWILILFDVRTASLLFLLLWAGVTRQYRAPQHEELTPPYPFSAYLLAATTGFAEMLGLTIYSYSIGIHLVAIDVTSVIASSYSLLPLLVGVVALRERLLRRQLAGIALVLAGVVGLAQPAWAWIALVAVFVVLAGALSLVLARSRWFPDDKGRCTRELRMSFRAKWL